MSRWIRVCGSGFGGAATAGFLFWMINSTEQVNGVGLLRRQDWPINSVWVWVAVGAIAGAVSEWIAGTRRVAHARATRELAEGPGGQYAQSYSLPDGARSMPVFAQWSEGRNAVTSHENNVPVTLFDFTTVSRDSDSRTVRQRTAALLPAKGLPAFDLRPRTLGRRILGWAGFEGLTFDPVAANGADAATVQQFTELFHLSAMDPVALMATLSEDIAPESAARETAIRRLFTPAVMERVNRYPAYAMQAHSDFLAVWRGSGVLPAGDRAELLDAALDLHDCLTLPPEVRAEDVIPARVGTDSGRQARKFRNTVVGGVAGTFAGFILAAMVLSVLFFGHAPGKPGALNFLLLPLLFVGCLFAGAAVGAGIGTRIPILDIPPGLAEDPVRRKSREKAIGCAVLFGFFAGFFGGFALFVATKILFDWKFDNFGFEGAIFFGSIFGSALVTAVTCGIVMNRLYRRRDTGRDEVR